MSLKLCVFSLNDVQLKWNPGLLYGSLEQTVKSDMRINSSPTFSSMIRVFWAVYLSA